MKRSATAQRQFFKTIDDCLPLSRRLTRVICAHAHSEYLTPQMHHRSLPLRPTASRFIARSRFCAAGRLFLIASEHRFRVFTYTHAILKYRLAANISSLAQSPISMALRVF
jgi:hypothetical protein